MSDDDPKLTAVPTAQNVMQADFEKMHRFEATEGPFEITGGRGKVYSHPCPDWIAGKERGDRDVLGQQFEITLNGDTFGPFALRGIEGYALRRPYGLGEMIGVLV